MINYKSLLNVEIKRIDASYAKSLYILTSESDTEYLKYFTPFEISERKFAEVLSKAVRDCFFGVFVGSALAGFYMLRGFDDGYDIPAYGLFISEKFAGQGLGSLTVQHAITFCKVNKIRRLLLKVYPDNLSAKALYEGFGFKAEGVDPKNNNLVFYKDI